MYSRIEIVFPIRDGVLRHRIRQEILEVALQDNVKARYLQPDGTYTKAGLKKGEKPLQSQTEFIKLAQHSAREATATAATGGKYRKVKLLPKRSR
jgi:polyphosphate kinase